MNLRNMNLRNKAILLMVLILLSVLSINTIVLMKVVTGRYKNALLVKTTLIGKGIKSEISRPAEVGVPLGSLLGVNDMLRRLIEENKDIGYSMVVDSTGKILFHNDQVMISKTLTEIPEMEAIKTEEFITKPVGDYYETTLPLFGPEKKLVGFIKVALKKKELSAQISSMLLKSITVALVGFILGITLVAFFVSRFITRPITTFASTAFEITRGDFTKTIEIRSNDEVGELGGTINRMVENLGNIFKRFKSAAMNVSMAAEQIAINSKKMTTGSRTQVEAVEKTSSSLQELNSTIREIANSVSTLSTSAVETSSSVLEISSSIEEVANSTSGLAGTISETTASLEQIGASVKKVARSAEVLEEAISETGGAAAEIDAAIRTVADNAKESSMLAGKVVSDASEFGMVSVVNAIDGMDKIKGSVKKAGDSVNHLKERSLEINKIVAVIDAVTSRTNLLALNAAILAAQAGEHGKSFSVVAEEIRELAEKTSASTKEIADLIVTIQQETQDTVDIMKEGLIRVDDGNKLVYAVGDALRTIIHSSQQSQVAAKGIEGAAVEQARGVKQVTESVERVKDMIVNIANAIRELRNGTDQIVKAMEVVDSISKHVKKAMEDQSSGSRQIGSVAENTVEKTRLISKATEEQRIGTESILRSIDEVKTVAVEGMDIASEIDLAMEGIRKDAEDLKRVVEVFKVK
ncbi:MAG: HAMP domain-containing protein [Nitrospirae bacterium]|nr:HAMP domain-containing protein [Nitrospirota bacterium]